MNCAKCGGDIIGNGYSSVMHCEYADEADYEDAAPDDGLFLCNYEEAANV